MDLDRDTELLFFQAVLSEDLQAAEQVILSIVDRLAVGNTQDIKKLNLLTTESVPYSTFWQQGASGSQVDGLSLHR